ncbi:hypothetical protein ABFG95_02330 [Achromobacter sp. HNDS-1]|jgi:hypothetical protein|uniref:Uncharacterized protein n=1 Tax=Achromobacter sp. HNDS-1 TaxID=3151598 RepID=A0AAU7LBQ4_9BURK|nr:hypothetical protein [Achromobacter ruhlandii]MCI1837961.1 hypothetical protein [Achromobacter ruhlandii]
MKELRLFSIPTNDISEWKRRLRSESTALVLREIARRYSIGRSDLGMVLPDLCDNVMLEHIQVVWNWDVECNGKGVSDEKLEALLAGLDFKK